MPGPPVRHSSCRNLPVQVKAPQGTGADAGPPKVRRRRIRALALALAAACLVCLSAGGARADYPTDYRDFATLRSTWQSKEKTQPEECINAYRAFLQVLPERHPEFALGATSLIINVTYTRLKQAEAALALCDETLEKYKESPLVVRTLADKARILLYEGRAPEAQALLKKEWPKVMDAHHTQVGAAVTYYYQSLRAQGKRDEAIAAIRKAVFENPALMDTYLQGDVLINTRTGWLYDAITSDLARENNFDEALRWAKLCFLTTPHNKWGMEEGVRVVTRVLRMRDCSEHSAKAFEAAMRDPTKPNVLATVKLPDFDPAKLEARLDIGGHWAWLYGRFVLGRTDECVDRATKMLAAGDNPILACEFIAMAFRAQDLNYVRMSRWQEFYKTNRGPTALSDFLKQNPPGKAGL